MISGLVTVPGERTGSIRASLLATGCTEASIEPGRSGTSDFAPALAASAGSARVVSGGAAGSLGGVCLSRGVHAGTKLMHNPPAMMQTQLHRIVRDLVKCRAPDRTSLAQRGPTISS